MFASSSATLGTSSQSRRHKDKHGVSLVSLSVAGRSTDGAILNQTPAYKFEATHLVADNCGIANVSELVLPQQ